ncbi:hypothetical protein D3C81_1706290 [compost metagenome]
MRIQFATQDEILATQMGAIKTTTDCTQYLVDAERLEQEIRRTGTQGTDRGFQIGKGGDQDNVVMQAEFAYFLQPVHTGFAGQRVIQNDQIEMLLPQ